MIWHFLEVWTVFLVVFAVGCGLGAMIHVGIAAGPAAEVQDSFANAIGDGIDRLKWRLGIAPDWRPEFRRTYEWPDLDISQNGHPERELSTVETDDEDWARESPPSGDDWTDEEEWSDGGVVVASEGYEDETFARAEAAHFEDADGDVSEHRELDMMRPAGLSEPRAGVPDNLQRIWGIGKRNEALLNNLGIYHFGQIASWTPAEARWVASRLTFPERLERDNWIGQAIVLATGGDPSDVSPSNRLKGAETDDG